MAAARQGARPANGAAEEMIMEAQELVESMHGLTRNPAGYSRGMMFALQGLHTVSLAPMGNSTGKGVAW